MALADMPLGIYGYINQDVQTVDARESELPQAVDTHVSIHETSWNIHFHRDFDIPHNER